MLEVSDEVVRASTPLGAGLGYSQNMCGSLTAAALALGLKYGRADLQISRKPSWSRGHRLVERFVERFQTVSCAEITGRFEDFSSPARIGHKFGLVLFPFSAFSDMQHPPNCLEFFQNIKVLR